MLSGESGSRGAFSFFFSEKMKALAVSGRSATGTGSSGAGGAAAGAGGAAGAAFLVGGLYQLFSSWS